MKRKRSSRTREPRDKKVNLSLRSLIEKWIPADLVPLIYGYAQKSFISWHKKCNSRMCKGMYIGPCVRWSSVEDQQFIKTCDWHSFHVQNAKDSSYTKNMPKDASGVLWLTVRGIHYPWKHESLNVHMRREGWNQQIAVFFTIKEEESIQTFLRKLFPKFFSGLNSLDLIY